MGDRISERKLRLFAVACCRRVWHLDLERMDPDAGSNWIGSVRNAVVVGERYADGEATGLELEHAHGVTGSGVDLLYAFIDCCSLHDDELRAVSENVVGGYEEYVFSEAQVAADPIAVAKDAGAVERSGQAALLRDLIGNPFRKVTLHSVTLSPTIKVLAEAAYQERTLPVGHLELARLAVLSDALEEAGCSDTEILTHLRSSGPHLRACWALDLILGKE